MLVGVIEKVIERHCKEEYSNCQNQEILFRSETFGVSETPKV